MGSVYLPSLPASAYALQVRARPMVVLRLWASDTAIIQKRRGISTRIRHVSLT